MRRLGIWTLIIAGLAVALPARADDHTLRSGGLTATVTDEFSIDSNAVSHLDVVVANNSSVAYKSVTISIGIYNHANGIIETSKSSTPRISPHGSWVFTVAIPTSSSSIARYKILALTGRKPT